VVWNQLNALTDNLDQYKHNIERHIHTVFGSDDQSTLEKLSALEEEVTRDLQADLEGSEPGEPSIQRVEVVDRPSIQERLETSVGPYLEFGGVGLFVVILVIFILVNRDSLSDRI